MLNIVYGKGAKLLIGCCSGCSQSDEGMPHLDAMQQHAIGYPHAISNHAFNADGDVWSDFAIFPNFCCWVHNVIAHKIAAFCQL